MNPVIEQIIQIFKTMPKSRKIILAAVTLLMTISFAVLIFWANKIEYKTMYSDLSTEDAGAIVQKLKEQKIPYSLEKGGSTIKIPEDKVYETRLSLAAEGLPKGSGVGYEIFDQTEFGTTEFVQKMNYQRALQGELSRTISEMDEVLDAKVMIVLPKDSVFVEETKPPTASVLLRLQSDLPKSKVDAVVHLVASAIEGLVPENITVADTTGKVLFKGMSEEEKMGMMANAQLSYKQKFETDLTQRIQSMLEAIVGMNKAIVRVTADMNFDRVNINEETYDPEVQVVRSRKNIAEAVEKTTRPIGNPSSVNPIVPPGQDGLKEVLEKSQKQNDTVNYEISKTVRQVTKPVADLQRLSVAAVIDGSYEWVPNEKGVKIRKFVPRSDVEMQQFNKIVRNAMGYSDDRGDQISVESFAFSGSEVLESPSTSGFDLLLLKKEYGRLIANMILILLLFLFVIRPIMTTVKEIKKAALPPEPEKKPLDELSYEKLKELEYKEAEDHKPKELSATEKAVQLAKEDLDRSVNILKNWINEVK
ncbi:MAG: flagellar M-ring protein FliF [Desulfobacterales bacterium]|nr:flagellar M-ring protein FliF [Desulfobacterales bacterium]